MSKELDIIKRSIVAAEDRGAANSNYPVPFARPDSGFAFRYSYTEISARGGDVSIKRRDTRFANGKLTTEEYEGALDGAAYDDMVRQAQSQFFNQMASLMKLFFLPFSGRGGR